MAVDSAGDVFITGGSEVAYASPDFYTAKYSGATGALLWERRLTGPSSNAGGGALGVDAAGNVLVTGHVTAPGGSNSPAIYTAKYSGANGALFWEKTFTGPGSYDQIESPKQFALTPDGGAVVACISWDVNHIYEYATIKYLPVFAPVVTTGGASAITSTGVTLAATINPKGAPTTWHIDYGTTIPYTNSTANQNAGSDTSPVSLNATVSGLAAHMLYHYRASATNLVGSATGDDATFTTGNTNPVAGTGTATVTTGETVTVTLPFTSPDVDGDVVTVTGTSGGAGLFTIGAVNGNQVTVSGVLNAVGTAALNFTVSDGFGGTATGSVQVTVADNDAPVITILGANPATTEAGSPYLDAGATARDAVAGNLTAVIQTASNVNVNVPGNYTFTYTVSDGSNTATASRGVQVVDTTAPIITHIPNPISVKADATNHAPVPDFTGDLTAIDNVGVTSVRQSPVVGTIVGYGPHTITLTVEDAAHNQSTCITTLIVDDGPALPGRYAGLLADAQGVAHALMELKLTRGQFLTGYLRLENGARVRLPGTVVPVLTHTATLGLSDGSSLELVFDGFGHVGATLTNGERVLTSNGVLANAAAPPGVPGKYTAFLESTESAAPGWLYSVVSSRGAMRLSGALPDGSPVAANQGSIVDRHGDAFVFLLGKKGTSALLAGQVHFVDLPTSDFAGTLAFNGAPCVVNGAKFTPGPSGLPAGPYPLALTGAGVDIASTVTLLPNNSATVLPPVKAFTPRSKAGLPSTGLFYLTFRKPATPTGPLLKGNGIFHQKLGIGVGQFKAGGGFGRVQLGPVSNR